MAELLSYSRVKSPSSDPKLAMEENNKGNEFFKKGNWQRLLVKSYIM